MSGLQYPTILLFVACGGGVGRLLWVKSVAIASQRKGFSQRSLCRSEKLQGWGVGGIMGDTGPGIREFAGALNARPRSLTLSLGSEELGRLLNTQGA